MEHIPHYCLRAFIRAMMDDWPDPAAIIDGLWDDYGELCPEDWGRADMASALLGWWAAENMGVPGTASTTSTSRGS